VHLVAVVPTYTIGDGEYEDVVVGRPAAFGFALQPTSTRPARPGADAVVQDGAPIPTSTITGTVIRPTDQAPAVLDDGRVRPLLATSDDAWTTGDVLAVTGRLVVEPYLWATEGKLWPALPDAVRLWSVEGIRRVTGAGTMALDALPGPEELDHDATYVLDLVAS
jgi:hypothetical protein